MRKTTLTPLIQKFLAAAGGQIPDKMTIKAARAELNKTGAALFQALRDKYMKVELKTLPYEPACFAGGTLVHTKNGLVPIEQIQVGDWVLSKHESGEGEREYKRVTKTFVHEDREVVQVRFGGVQADGTNHYRDLVVTPKHPFWVQGKGWKEVGKLKAKYPAQQFELLLPECADIGGSVRLFRTENPEIAWHPIYDKAHMLQCTGWRFHVPTVRPIEQDVFVGIESVRRSGRVKPDDLYRTTVYNLEVENFHTYYVGEAGVWVHNKNVGRATTEQIGKPVTGYSPSASEVTKPFYGKSELYGYLADHSAEAKNGVYVIRSSELSQVEKGGMPIDPKDLPRWLQFEEYAPGRLVDSLGNRFEYALSYFDTIRKEWRFLAIEGRAGKNTFVDQKLQMIKAGDQDGAMELLFRTALRLKANPEEKIIYQFNPKADGGESAALVEARQFIKDIQNGLKWTRGSTDQNALITWLADSEGDRLILQNADLTYRVPQEVLVEGDGIGVEALPMAAIDALLPIAKQYWLDAGASSSLLDAASFQIADLPIGFAAWTEGLGITLDTSGAGWGWFVDGTPLDASEFGNADSDTAWHVADEAATDNPAAGRLDLLTVLIHELGHIVSLPSTATANDVMSQYLAPGQRRLLSGADVTALQAAGAPYFLTLLGAQTITTGLGNEKIRYGALVAGNALDQVQATLSDPGFTGQAGWQTQGDVHLGNGTATLSETPTAQTRLNQAFVLGPNDRFLSFTLSGIALDNASSAPDDAFEVALIDANTGLSLLGNLGLSHDDAFYNLQADGTEFKASGVSTVRNADGSRTVLVDLAGVAVGTVVNLSFDMIGFGLGAEAVSSHVTVKDLHLGQPLQALDDAASLAEDASIVINALANDIGATAVGVKPLRVNGPAHGNVAITADGSFRYTPVANWFGEDSFSYSLTRSDGGQEANVALVKITVTPVNDAPSLQKRGQARF